MPEGRQGSEGALETARDLVGAALAALEANRERIDNLNVYPVPDGDTGTNMALTVRAVRDALARSGAAGAEAVAREAARAALMGARGNSGVILSQLARGAAQVLGEGGTVDAALLARALRTASDAGYAAVREPQEGTILSVAMLLRHALKLEQEAALIEAAVEQALNAGLRTPDTALAGEQALVTHEVGDAIARAVESGEVEAQAAVAV